MGERLTVNTIKASCERIAREIGGEITASRVESLVEISNRNGQIVHGIKNAESAAEVNKTGVAPKTPEGGNVSYWAMGHKIFATNQEDTALQFFDTPFFHYAYSQEADMGIVQMAIALTYPQIADINTQGKKDVQIKLNIPISRENMGLIIIRQKIKSKNYSIKQVMFSQLENMLHEGYKGGEYRQIKLG